MEHWKQEMAEIMEIKDPRKALIEIMMLVDKENLEPDVLEEAMDEYMAKHGVKLEEMALYPDGERVLTPEMFQD